MEEFQEPTEELKKGILDAVSCCIRCRFCIPSCPLFEITEGWVTQGASGIIQALFYAIKFGVVSENRDALRNLLFSCTTCKNCSLTCKKMSVGVDLLDAIKKGRQLYVEEMLGPMPTQRKAFESLLKYGNPYGNLPEERSNWAKGLDVPEFTDGVNHEVLYYVGCTPSYDDRAQKVARAVVQLLKKARVQFGILKDETCCGCPADRMGEELLFQELADKNWNRFASLNVKQIVTTSPHCYDTFVNCYPEEMGNEIEIRHYTQFVLALIKQGKLPFQRKIGKKVSYQDPCYLGRHNDIYDDPREILKNIPGTELVEMKRSKEDCLCCGGGGGRMWADFSEEVARLADIRVREAAEVGAEILVTACPFCLINMEDAIKTNGLEGSLEAKDLAELILDAV